MRSRTLHTRRFSFNPFSTYLQRTKSQIQAWPLRLLQLLSPAPNLPHATKPLEIPLSKIPGGFYPWVAYTDSEDVECSIEPCYEDATGCPDGNFALKITANAAFENSFSPPCTVPTISLNQTITVCSYITYYETFNLRYTGTTGVNGTDPICEFGFNIGDTEDWEFGAANQNAWYHWGNGPYYHVTYKKPFETGSETYKSFYLIISCDAGTWEIWLDNITVSTTCTGGNFTCTGVGYDIE